MRDSFKAYCQEKLMPRITLANRNEGEFFIFLISIAIILYIESVHQCFTRRL